MQNCPIFPIIKNSDETLIFSVGHLGLIFGFRGKTCLGKVHLGKTPSEKTRYGNMARGQRLLLSPWVVKSWINPTFPHQPYNCDNSRPRPHSWSFKNSAIFKKRSAIRRSLLRHTRWFIDFFGVRYPGQKSNASRWDGNRAHNLLDHPDTLNVYNELAFNINKNNSNLFFLCFYFHDSHHHVQQQSGKRDKQEQEGKKYLQTNLKFSTSVWKNFTYMKHSGENKKSYFTEPSPIIIQEGVWVWQQLT